MTSFYFVSSYARHGTHLTRSLLHQHPEITCYGELTRRLANKSTRPSDGRDVFIPWMNRPVREFFEHYTLMEHPTRHVGFVLHSPDVQGRKYPSRGRAIGRFLGRMAWPAIEVRRKDLLATFASHTLAHRSDEWGYNAKKQHTHGRVTFTKRGWKEHLRRTFHYFGHARKRLYSGQPLIQFWYEDIVTDFEKASKQMHEFLGVEPMGFKPTTVKQEKRPLNEVFTNWDTVVARLTGTKWEGCLHGEPPEWQLP
jgi:hypothetical protein